MQQQNTYNSSEAARLLGVNNTTVQRAIQRGDLAGTRPRDRSPFQIERAELLRWAAANRYTLHVNGGQIDPATGEVIEQLAESTPAVLDIEPGVEVPPTPIAAATAARARLAGLPTVSREDRLMVQAEQSAAQLAHVAREVESNVSRLLLPSADAGILEACRRLVALPESPQLWQALRAVLAVEAGE